MKPFETLEEIGRCAAEAVVAQSGISHAGLARQIRHLLVSGDANTGAILQEPVIEGAHPFVEAEETIRSLTGRMLHPDLVEALDGGSDQRPRNYVFKRSWHPFKHQLEAWRKLICGGDPQSVIVTSGTGSGKTECFLIPILNDLAEQAAHSSGPLEGVQAIMLYPLNALIESQKERFSEWIAPFRGRIRFGLYNGDTPPSARDADRRRTPEQVIDREVLRAAPPPILVTNPTMLEYMLVRSQDAPILTGSRGKLKWVVLDEAHSLVGAAAAEIALLLRRVLLAFEVKSSDVRFVATSATIGEGEGVKKQLEIFLAEVAGIPNGRVHMIEGHRRKPPRPHQRSRSEMPADISLADPYSLYDALAGRDRVWSLVETLHAGTVPLKAFSHVATELNLQPTDLAVALSRARCRPKNGLAGDILAPLRIHAFQRAMPGLWSCVNSACPDAVPDWPFGRILTERGEHCTSCAAPVLQIISCSICGEPLLEGEERGGRLITPLTAPPVDEFRDEAEREKSGEEDTDSVEVGDDESSHLSDLIGHRRLFAARPSKEARPFFLERETWMVADAPSESTLKLLSDEAGGNDSCPCCGGQSKWKSPLRPMRFGAPFLLGNTAPILLAGMSSEVSAKQPLPTGGRRLLSFTDSRQGTARLAAKFQVDAERNFVRSVIYHTVQTLMRPAVGAEDEIKVLNETIKALEVAGAGAPGSPLRSILDGKIAERAKLTSGNMEGIAWSDMVNRLSERIEVQDWIKEVWEGRDPGEGRFTDTTRLAEFLLLREFGRRPTRANSIETLGLAKLRSSAIDLLTDASVPEPFRRRGWNRPDWQDYLYVLLTHFVRANSAITIEDWLRHWLLPKAPLRQLAGPNDVRGRKEGFIPWPSGARLSLRSRPVLLLQKGLKLDLADPADLDDIDICLRKAWDALRDPLTSSRSSERALAFEKTFVAPVIEAFWCPVTRRPLDRVAFGISPYSLGRGGMPTEVAERIEMPRHPAPSAAGTDHEPAREAIRSWLATNKHVTILRERGGWKDLNDRIALFADYARSAEHSAQQDSPTLRTYEKAFKEGRINVLSCSTTMEMGVDIGSVESVMMTNVPPSIASYRQRVGRSGRRGQSLSLAFTFCKDRPLDREAFRDPSSYLTRKVAAPRVALNSGPIVQRHVNAYLLGAFLREHEGEAIAMTIGEFFGCPAALETPRQNAEGRASESFVRWVERPEVKLRHSDALTAIVERSVLEGDRTLIDATLQRLRSVEQRFLTDWEGLRQLAQDEGMRDAARTAMGFQLNRLCDEFLLGALADRAFLPGHGFPTHVVQFVTNSIARRKQAADRSISGENRFRGRGSGPQRQLDLAIRDYAPGAEVVVDGLVYKSAGVTLNWKRPASVEGIKEVQGLLHQWTCARCGAADVERGGAPEFCPVCSDAGLKTSRFLRPGGFTVDSRAAPHADVDEVDYIPPEKPEVSTRNEPWQSLPDPRLGRYRTSREGLVFYASRGASGEGYALCLECGRASAESAGDDPELPRALIDHTPLRRRRDLDSNLCPGNGKPFAIQRRLALGHEITTDVFELQPSAPLTEAAANALVIALREALAQELGIEASEMGCAVARRRNALGGQVFSLFLYDRAAGGGGFSVLAEPRLRSVIDGAQKILDCKTPGCERACSACVLTSDAPDGPDALDRRPALEFVKLHLTLPDDLMPEDMFVPGAIISEYLLDEVDSALRSFRSARLNIWLAHAPDPAALAQWRLAPQLFEWAYRGRRALLILPPGAVEELSAADKLALRDFLTRSTLDLAEAKAPTFGNGASALCAVETEHGLADLWASRDIACRIAGETWGRPHEYPIANIRTKVEISAKAINQDMLLPPPGAQVHEIGSELDGSLQEFGARAAKLFQSLLKKGGIWPSSGISEIRYQDAFVASPLVARLFLDSCAALARLSGATTALIRLETRAPRQDASRYSPHQAFHDWEDADIHAKTIRAYGGELGFEVIVSQVQVPHGRYLTINFENGSRARVILDQGFGGWRAARGARLFHAFDASVQIQAASMCKWSTSVTRAGVGSSYVVAM